MKYYNYAQSISQQVSHSEHYGKLEGPPVWPDNVPYAHMHLGSVSTAIIMITSLNMHFFCTIHFWLISFFENLR